MNYAFHFGGQSDSSLKLVIPEPRVPSRGSQARGTRLFSTLQQCTTSAFYIILKYLLEVVTNPRLKLGMFSNWVSIVKFLAYVFTNLGKEGREGPADASGYLGTTLEGQVTLNAGIQMWQVPYTGTYIIESRGAAGANGTCYKPGGPARTWHRGGLGAKINGTFWLTHGTLLKILVGQRGMMDIYLCSSVDGVVVGGGGGGGGSFVTYVNNTPLVIAGGGGGGGSGCSDGCVVVAGKFDGDPGQLGVFGSRCNSTVGNGGMLCSNENGYGIYAGSGAGLLSNGSSLAHSWLHHARCFVDGGRGGTDILYDVGDGGFGGGGFGLLHGGGGGGYTGGGVWGNSTNAIAGGGGSVNHGFDKQSGYGDALEHGLVKIVFLG